MKFKFFIPLLAQIGLVVWIAALLYLTPPGLVLPTFVRVVLLIVIPIMFYLIGLIFMWAGKATLVMKIIYSIAFGLFLAGMGSFAIFRAPTTINLLGGLLIIGGIILGSGIAVAVASSEGRSA